MFSHSLPLPKVSEKKIYYYEQKARESAIWLKR